MLVSAEMDTHASCPSRLGRVGERCAGLAARNLSAKGLKEEDHPVSADTKCRGAMQGASDVSALYRTRCTGA